MISLLAWTAFAATPNSFSSIPSVETSPAHADLGSSAAIEYRYVPPPADAPSTAPSAATLEEVAGSALFGTADTWRWNLQFGGGTDFKSDGSQLYLIGGGVTYFIADDLSLDLELNAIHFDQRGENAQGVNVNLLFRWHCLHDDDRTWTLYVDGGAGLLVTSNKVPFNGSEFNFTPQLGAGLSFDLGDDVRLLTGVRWHHTSNANLYEDNPGRDSLLVYAGLSFPF